MSSAWDDEQATCVEHRRLVEARATGLPTEPDALGQRARRAVGHLRPSAWALRRATEKIRRRGQRFVLAARAWPARARHRPPAVVDTAPAAGPIHRAARVTCVVFGAAGGTAAHAARVQGCHVVVAATPAVPIELGASEFVCLMAGTTEPTSPGWLDRLIEVVGADTVAAGPTVVHPIRRLLQATPCDGLVRDRGLQLAVDHGAPVLRARDVGAEPRPQPGVQPVDALTGACVLVTRRALDSAGGIPPLADVDAAAIELSARLHDNGGHLVVAGDVLALDHRPVVARADLHQPLASRPAEWRALVGRHGPTFLRRATNSTDDPRLRIAVTIGAPSEKLAPRWGDWHFAGALARAFERHGHIVRVQTADHADDLAGRACDVHLVLRGLRSVERTPGQRHVLWIISHPEAVAVHECDDADLVLVASARFAEVLRTQTSTPVEVLLQATDHHRFRRVPARPEHRHDVAVVAKTRDVPRPIVVDAIAAGLRPAIYGTGWEAIVDPTLVVEHYVPNDTLPVVYSSVGVLLNDHWDTMRNWGFVSNRLFDALACGTPVISDDMPEIRSLFGDTVSTVRSPQDLRVCAEAILDDLPAARARADRGRAIVLAAHTFDRRADQIVELLGRHGLLAGADRRRS